MAFTWLAGVLVPPERLGLHRWVWVGLVFIAANGLLVVVGRLTRWLLPLAALMKLTLVFPDHAPSRTKAALRQSNSRTMLRNMEEARARGETSGEALHGDYLVQLLKEVNDHDRLTRGHSERVRAYAEMLGEELGLGESDMNKLRWSALLHDVGKLSVPSEVLNSDRRPTDDEWAILSGHPAAARPMLEPLAPWLGEWVHAADQHHCRWDGKGYPDQIGGHDIALAGRLVAIADAYDVMTSARSYKTPLSPELARQELTDCAGSHFDPALVKAFLRIGLGRLKAVAGPLAWLANLTGSAQLQAPAASSVTSAAWSAAVAAIGIMIGTVGGLGPEGQESPPDTLAFESPSTIQVDNVAATGIEGEALELVLVAHGARAEPVFTIGGPAHGTVSEPSTPSAMDGTSDTWRTTVDYQPRDGFVGQDGFSFEVCTSDGCAIARVAVVIGRANRPPETTDDLTSVVAGGTVVIDVLGNDQDPDGDELSLRRIGVVLEGAATIVNQRIVYDAGRGVAGPVTFEYVVSDGADAESNGTVTVEVIASTPATSNRSTSTTAPTPTTRVVPVVNSRPTAVDDTATVVEDTAALIAVLANDSDPNADPLFIAGVGTPLHGTASIESSQIRYTPSTNYQGSDQFTYTIGDGVNPPVVATVTVTVAGVNDPPTSTAPDSVISEGATPGTSVAAVSAADADGDRLSYAITSGDATGVFTIDAAGVIRVAGPLDRETTPGYSLGVRIADPTTAIALAVTITITDIDEQPLVVDDAAPTLEDTPRLIVLGANDADPEGLALTWNTPNLSTAGGTLVEFGGTVFYTPVAEFSGTDTFVYTATDPAGNTSAPATVTIVVTAVNDPPVVGDDGGVDFTTPEDTSITTADVTVNDIDVDHPVDPTSVMLVAGPFNGGVVNNGDGTFTYTPNLNYVGTDSFTYTITDAAGATSNTATVTIVVTAVNDPPVAVNDNGSSYTTAEDIALTTPDVTANDSDLEDGPADPTSVTLVAGPLNGGVVNNGDGTFTYTPNLNYTGTDTFTYTIRDSALLLSNTATVTIIVTPVNDPPVANSNTLTVGKGAAGTTVDVRLDDTDLEGGPLTVVAVSNGTNGTAVENGDGTITYTHNDTSALSDTFTYTIADPGGLQDTATVVVTIVPPEDNDGRPAAVDNCPFMFNPDQADTDNDTIGDACDPTSTATSTATFTDTGQDLGAGKSFAVAATDVDGDGDLDAVYANLNEPNTVWLNNGIGTFTNSGQTLGTSTSVALAAADLDNDGDADLVFANNAGAPNTVWLNNASGIFTNSGQTLGSESTEDVAVGDLDSDGDLDLVFANDNAPNTIWLNNGAGVFTDSGQTLGSNKGAGVAVGDVDGDGDLDLAFAHDGDDNTVWLNDGTGVFTDSGQSLGSGRSHDPALVDLDGDGDLDLAIAEDNDGDSIWLNNGTGTFIDTGQTLGLGHSRAISVGDLDGDGDPDIILGDHIGPNSVWLNNGTGTFTDSSQRLGNDDTEGVTTADLDNDGTLDLLTANDNDPNRVWLN